MAEVDTKPDVDSKPEFITLKVQDMNGESLQFRIKKGAPLKKLMDAFCKSRKVRPGTFRFHFEGERINDADSPASLEMEDNCQIAAFLEQAGGIHA